jgi:hypothetical protein
MCYIIIALEYDFDYKNSYNLSGSWIEIGEIYHFKNFLFLVMVAILDGVHIYQI